MAGQTRATRSSLEEQASKHDNVSENIGTQQSKLATEIATMTSANKGSMWQALQTAHETWDAQCKSIRKNLEGMAQNVRKAAQMLGERDAESAQAVNKVEIPSTLGSSGMNHLS